MAATFKTKMAVKIRTRQLASIKIPIEQYLIYLCAKIQNCIELRTSPHNICKVFIVGKYTQNHKSVIFLFDLDIDI